MFRSIIAVMATLAVPGFVHAQDAVQWTQAEGGNGHWYSVEPTDRISWLDSQQLAEDRGGYMITMLSAEENQFFCDTFCDLPNLDIPGYRGFWMGLRYENSEWNWQTGEPFSYSNFASDGQDNLPAAQYAVFEKDGEWGNEDGSYPEFNPVWLAVEYSADCNGDGIVDYGQILDGSLSDGNGNGIPDCCDDGIPCDGEQTIWGWGDNTHGSITIPSDLSYPSKIAAGDHSVALLSDGTIRCWGKNNFNQCIPPSNLGTVIDVSAGDSHTLALLADGSVVAWGSNVHGQTNVPTTLGNSCRAISAGSNHSLAIDRDGRVVSWGYNPYGATDVPSALGEAVAISGGAHHSLALTPNGTVFAWGGIDGESNVPGGLQNVVSIRSNNYNNLALTGSGEVYAWGRNWFSQCDVPSDLPSCSRIAIASESAMALTNDGDLICWGDAGLGECDIPLDLGNIDGIQGGGRFMLAWISSAFIDCNNNGIDDAIDIGDGTSQDCNSNLIPDECENLEDCNSNDIPDICEALADCNSNDIPDVCEALADCNSNGVPDVCETLSDCDGDGTSDACEILDGAVDANPADGIPDECQGLPVGACCVNGQCSGLTAEQCFNLDGNFAGIGISCADADCPTTCAGDVNGDNQIGIVDLLTIIDGWGFCP